MTTIMMPIADGSEELEVVTVLDLLARAELKVLLISCNPNKSTEVLCSRGVKLIADAHIEEIETAAFDMVILPGGVQGATTLRDNSTLTHILEQQFDSQGWCAAICAAPAIILTHHNLLGDAKATCYPSFLTDLTTRHRSDQAVIVDDEYKLITSQGPGTAIEFALTIIQRLAGETTQQRVAKALLTTPI